jgi:hypothetical protein
MKTSFEVGGPAFPQAVMNDEGEIYHFHDWHGMSLRDYFAAKAMQAQLARTTWGIEDDATDMAQEAYTYADAMLEARK